MTRYRLTVLLAWIAIIPIGLASKFYRGPLDTWLNDYAGGVFYEIFWILLVVLLWPRLAAGRVALGVFLVTAILEFLQLWHPPFLTEIRGTLIGRLLIGTTFSGWDFPHYVLGCILAWLWLRQLDKN